MLITNSALLWLLVLLNFIFTFVLAHRMNSMTPLGSAQPPSARGLPEGAPAPHFTAQTLDGKTVTLQHYLGKQAVFVFFSAHCQPCQELLPHLEALKQGAMQANVNLILVSSNKLRDTRLYIKQKHISLPTLIAPQASNTFISDYKSTMTPSYCHLDERGRVLSAGIVRLDTGIWKDFAGLVAPSNVLCDESVLSVEFANELS